MNNTQYVFRCIYCESILFSVYSARIGVYAANAVHSIRSFLLTSISATRGESAQCTFEPAQLSRIFFLQQILHFVVIAKRMHLVGTSDVLLWLESSKEHRVSLISATLTE